MKKFIYPFLFLIALILYPGKEGAFDAVRVCLMLIVVLASIVHKYMVRNDKNLFAIDTLFIIGFLIVHFQWPLMLLTESSMRNLHIEQFINKITYSTWLSTLGFLAWIIGNEIFQFKRKPQNPIVSFNFKWLKWLFYVLFPMFLVTSGKEYLSGAIYTGAAMSNDYSGSAGGVAAYVQLLLGIVAPMLLACLMLDTIRLKRLHPAIWVRKIDYIPYLLLFIYTVMFLVIGDRGSAIPMVSVGLVIFGMYYKPVTLGKFALLVFAGAVVLTFIGLGRSSGAKFGDQGMVQDGLERMENQIKHGDAGYAFTINLANSATCVYLATDTIPRDHPYFNGKLWVSGFLAAVPLAQKTYASTYDLHKEDLSTSDYLTYLVSGPNATSGTGTTIIADIYMNFGPIGVIVLMFALGVLYKRVICGVHNKENFMWFVLLVAITCVAFYSGRAGYLVFYRSAIWSMILAYFTIKIKRQGNVL